MRNAGLLVAAAAIALSGAASAQPGSPPRVSQRGGVEPGSPPRVSQRGGVERGLPADPIKAASGEIGASALTTLRITGFGAGYSVGESPNSGGPWPRTIIRSYELQVDYETPAMQIDVILTGEARQQEFVSGSFAWNVAVAPKEAQPPEAVNARAAERVQMIWTTPHGFLRAAAANKAKARSGAGGVEVTFTANGRTFVGLINAGNQLQRVQTSIDNPVLGEVLVETVYSSYQTFDAVSFPMRIVQRTGGHPSLDLWISSVTVNPTVTIEVPAAVKEAAAR
jgi:hypothetical protein